MKRSALLADLSREHHHALVLAQGLKPDGNAGHRAKLQGTRAQRAEYLRHRFTTELEPHFQAEEHAFALLLPGRGKLDKAIAQMLDDHRAMRLLIRKLDSTSPETTLEQFGQRLENHVRFEERVLFPEVESQGSPTELAGISDVLAIRRRQL